MLNELTDSLNLLALQTQDNIHTIGMIMAVIWGAFIITRLVPQLLFLGIIPRNPIGIPGIALAPFLHANFNHVFFNSIPLIVLSNFILMMGDAYFIQVTFWIALISGILTWLFGRPAIHIGASAVITGYWSLLIINSYENPSIMTFILAIICLYYFMGIFLGVFPSKKGVSWEGHLFGFIAGVCTSLFYTTLTTLF